MSSARPAKATKLVDRCAEQVAWAVRQWPEIDATVEGITSHIATAHRVFDRAAADTLAALGLSHGELKVLLQLIRGERAPADIARGLLVSTGTMTNRLDKLEAASLLERHPDPADRRSVLVRLTPAGRKAADRYIGVQAGREKQLLSHLTAQERRQLNDLLRKLLASMESEGGSEPVS